jgi:hypothetical protein
VTDTQRTKEERFVAGVPALSILGECVLQVSEIGPTGMFIDLAICKYQGAECVLDMSDARALRDWLNKVIPS